MDEDNFGIMLSESELARKSVKRDFKIKKPQPESFGGQGTPINMNDSVATNEKREQKKETEDRNTKEIRKQEQPAREIRPTSKEITARDAKQKPQIRAETKKPETRKIERKPEHKIEIRKSEKKTEPTKKPEKRAELIRREGLNSFKREDNATTTIKDRRQTTINQKPRENARNEGGKMKSGLSSMNKMLITVVVGFILLYWITGMMPTENIVPLPKIELTTITSRECKDCFTLDPLVSVLRDVPINLTGNKSVEYESEEGKKLVEQYGITKLPTIVLRGQAVNLSISNYEIVNDALVFKGQSPVYYDIQNKRIVGEINITVITDLECKDCFDMETISQQIGFIAKVVKSDRLDYKSKEARELIKKYSIKTIPTILLSKDAIEYPQIKDQWEKIGTTETDGTMVARVIPPVFYDITNKSYIGRVTVTYIGYSKCKECYNVTAHNDVLKQLGITAIIEKKVDFAKSTKEVEKYNIEAIPTIIVSKEAELYPFFVQVWSEVGTQEADGSYVFRRLDLMSDAHYYNVTSKNLGYVPTQPPAKEPSVE